MIGIARTTQTCELTVAEPLPDGWFPYRPSIIVDPRGGPPLLSYRRLGSNYDP